MKLPVTNEDLRTWFRQKWVRMDTKGNIKGDCAREEGEGKPKCLPSAKAHSMSKEDRAAAARRKRRQDPVADRPGKGGKPINVRTEEMDLEEANKPTNPALWSRAKSLARSKFDVYPSAYANGWAAKWYKSKGGGWKSVSEGVDDEGGMAKGELETIADKAKSLSKMMKKNKQLDAWVQSKITKADDYIGSVHDYLKNSKQEVDEQMQKKSFFKLREQLDSICIDCDDSTYGSVEEEFEPTGEEQYEDWDLEEAKDTDKYSYIDQSKGQVIKGKSGTYVGYTHSATKGKGANILKHNQTKKYYAAGGSSTAFTKKTTLHDTPEDAARAYHKGNLAEASPMIKPPKNEFGKKEDAFAHAKKHGGKVMKKTFTHPTSGMQTVSYVVREDTELDEAIKLNSKVKIHAPGKDYHGKVGHVGEIRKGLHDKAPKTYTVDYDYDTKTGNKKSIQLDKSRLKMHNEEAEIDEAIKKPNATTRHLRDYPVSDKDVAKPITYYSLVHKATNKVLSTHKDLESAKDEHRGMDQGERAHYRIATTTKAPKSFDMTEEAEGAAENLELQEAEKNGKKVQLNKPFRTSDGKGKFAVYTKNDKGNVVKVNFGDTTGLTIKTSNPDRRRNFRARHNCDNPGPRHKARYWSCRSWSKDNVSAGLGIK